MRGVTLIETILVLCLITALAGLSIGPGIEQFELQQAQSDGTHVAAIARHARAQAMHGTPHSLFWSEDTHTLVVSAESYELYPLSGIALHATGTAIHFLGPEQNDESGTFQIGSWAITTNPAEAINLQHAL